MCFKKRSAPAPEPEKEVEEKVVIKEVPVYPSTGSSTESYSKTPNDAMDEQERLAKEELKEKRIERARAKQSLLTKRLERQQEYGSGKKVLTGKEKDLGKMASSSLITPATGKRSGSGRRSLLTGSTGGIGFYSRYL